MGDNNIFRFKDKDEYDKENFSAEVVDTFVYGGTFQSHPQREDHTLSQS